MEYTTDLNNRPWKAIQNGTKKIEVRTNTPYENIDYAQLQINDTINFINNETEEILTTKILLTNHYKTVKELLSTEDIKLTLSSGKDLKEGIESINNIQGYRENIPQHGVWAIHLTVV